MIRVLIADDHAMVRAGLAQMLSSYEDLEVVGEAANGEEAVQMVGMLSPDVVLMDMSMPIMDGLEALKLVKQRYGSTHVVILSTFQEPRQVSEALAAGASGYLVKDVGVAAVPGSSFYKDPAHGRTKLRFCYCKKDETLKEADMINATYKDMLDKGRTQEAEAYLNQNVDMISRSSMYGAFRQRLDGGGIEAAGVDGERRHGRGAEQIGDVRGHARAVDDGAGVRVGRAGAEAQGRAGHAARDRVGGVEDDGVVGDNDTGEEAGKIGRAHV